MAGQLMWSIRIISKRLAQVYFILLGIGAIYVFYDSAQHAFGVFDAIRDFLTFGMMPMVIVAICLLPILVVSTFFGEWHRHKEWRNHKRSHKLDQ